MAGRRVLAVVFLLFVGPALFADNLPEVAQGAQAVSLSGDALFAAAPGQGTLDRLAAAKKDYGGTATYRFANSTVRSMILSERQR